MSGPLPVLDSLTGENVKVILDLLHLAPGTYDIEPSVIVSGPDVIKTDTILPAYIRVIISEPTNVSDDKTIEDSNLPNTTTNEANDET